jgi:hypothetical protein
VRKCLHLYFYFIDRQFGLMHVRLQTWLPGGILRRRDACATLGCGRRPR